MAIVVTARMYLEAMKLMAQGGINFENDTIKAMLVKSGYTPNQDTDKFITVVGANEFVDANNQYVAGGKALTGKTNTIDTVNNRVVLDCNDISWVNISTNLGGIQHIIFYKDTGTPATSPVIGYQSLDQVFNMTEGTLELTISPNGLIRLTTA